MVVSLQSARPVPAPAPVPKPSSRADLADPAYLVLETPDGGHQRVARWPAPERNPVGALLLLEGLGEFIERYQEIAERYRQRGWQVFALDWRGQGRSDRFVPGLRGGHVPDFDLLKDDLLQVLDTVVDPARPPGRPLAVLAHSMGGLVALTAMLSRPPGPFAAVVLSCPLLGLRTDPFPVPVAKRLASALCRLGFGERYAFGQKPYDPALHGRFEDNVMTADRDRFGWFHEQYRGHPELAMGGVTFGWVDATFRAIDAVWTHPGLDRLAVPTLILSAPADRLIDAAPHVALANRLPRATLRLYPDSRHEPLMEVPAIRDRVLADIDAFLAAQA